MEREVGEQMTDDVVDTVVAPPEAKKSIEEEETRTDDNIVSFDLNININIDDDDVIDVIHISDDEEEGEVAVNANVAGAIVGGDNNNDNDNVDVIVNVNVNNIGDDDDMWELEDIGEMEIVREIMNEDWNQWKEDEIEAMMWSEWENNSPAQVDQYCYDDHYHEYDLFNNWEIMDVEDWISNPNLNLNGDLLGLPPPTQDDDEWVMEDLWVFDDNINAPNPNGLLPPPPPSPPQP